MPRKGFTGITISDEVCKIIDEMIDKNDKTANSRTDIIRKALDSYIQNHENEIYSKAHNDTLKETTDEKKREILLLRRENNRILKILNELNKTVHIHTTEINVLKNFKKHLQKKTLFEDEK